jgi:transposase
LTKRNEKLTAPAGRQQACAGSLKALKADLKSADKAIVELAQADPELKRLFERVTSIIGISQTTAAEIIVTTARAAP